MMWSSWSGWWWPGLLIMVFCLWMMVRMMGHGSHGSHRSYTGEPDGHASGGPERILADRLARGEIDIEEYQRRLAVLRQQSDAGTR